MLKLLIQTNIHNIKCIHGGHNEIYLSIFFYLLIQISTDHDILETIFHPTLF